MWTQMQGAKPFITEKLYAMMLLTGKHVFLCQAFHGWCWSRKIPWTRDLLPPRGKELVWGSIAQTFTLESHCTLAVPWHWIYSSCSSVTQIFKPHCQKLWTMWYKTVLLTWGGLCTRYCTMSELSELIIYNISWVHPFNSPL